MHRDIALATEVSANSEISPEGLTLADCAAGLGRAAVMKDILGPHLDGMLRPIYEVGIDVDASDQKLRSLEGEFPLRTLEYFFGRTRLILRRRFRDSVSPSEEYRQFLELNKRRPDLLFYAKDPSQNISEAIGASIGVPLTLASLISGLERPERERPYPLRDVDGLTEIMERESFHRILMRLTKGPNEFVGSGSDQFSEHNTLWFYNFNAGAGMRDRLRVHDAFDMEHGRVVGLSDVYALAAEQRRKMLRSRQSDRHRGNDSSGCPVRHDFEDAHGNSQESLVVTGSEFVVSALRYAEQIPLN